jgi:hypothetical protein
MLDGSARTREGDHPDGVALVFSLAASASVLADPGVPSPAAVTALAGELDDLVTHSLNRELPDATVESDQQQLEGARQVTLAASVTAHLVAVQVRSGEGLALTAAPPATPLPPAQSVPHPDAATPFTTLVSAPEAGGPGGMAMFPRSPVASDGPGERRKPAQAESSGSTADPADAPADALRHADEAARLSTAAAVPLLGSLPLDLKALGPLVEAFFSRLARLGEARGCAQASTWFVLCLVAGAAVGLAGACRWLKRSPRRPGLVGDAVLERTALLPEDG